MENYIEKLTDLQGKVGYKKGDINPIALLGLFGEAGEVLNETILIRESWDCYPELIKRAAVSTAKMVDNLKKSIRDDKRNVSVFIETELREKFDIELADALYYLNAIAINRGKTLNDYAEISYKKVAAKVQIDISQKK